MRIIGILIFLTVLSSCSEEPCDDKGCESVEQFAESYVEALTSKSDKRLASHYIDSNYTCYLDYFKLNGEVVSHSVRNLIELQGEHLDSFHLILNSEAAKVNLYLDKQKEDPTLSNSELWEHVIKTLKDPKYVRAEVPLKVMPELEFDLNIITRPFPKDHPCFLETNTARPIFLKKTRKGFRAIEPRCDVIRFTGKERIKETTNFDIVDSIFNDLDKAQIQEILDEIKAQRLSLQTLKNMMEKYDFSYKQARYFIYEKVCPAA